MSVPLGRVHLVQRIVLAAEASTLTHVRSAYQLAVQSVSPAVISALNASGEFSFPAGNQARAPVATNVVERLNHVRTVASDDDALARNFSQEVLARTRNLPGSSRAHPRPAVKALKLFTKEFGICVVARGQGLGGEFHLSVHSHN